MKPFALLFAMIAVFCAALLLAPAQAQQSGAAQAQDEPDQRAGKQRGYVTGNFAGELDGARTGLVPGAEAQQPAPVATLRAGVAPDTTAAQSPPIVTYRPPAPQPGVVESPGVRYRMFLPNGEPVRANVTEKQKAGPDRQRAREANEAVAGEDDDDD